MRLHRLHDKMGTLPTSVEASWQHKALVNASIAKNTSPARVSTTCGPHGVALAMCHEMGNENTTTTDVIAKSAQLTHPTNL